MLASDEHTSFDSAAPAVPVSEGTAGELKTLLERTFSTRFTLIDPIDGEVIERSPDQPARDWGLLGPLCRAAADRGRAEFIEDDDPLLTLALPCTDAAGRPAVATATFLTRPPADDEDLVAQARRLGMRPEKLRDWARRQRPWTAEGLRQITALVLDNAGAEHRLRALQSETENLSLQLASTYEEISLLHRLARNLKLSRSNEELGRIAIEWLGEVVPAAGFAVQLPPAAETGPADDKSDDHQSRLLRGGDCPIDAAEFSRLIDHLHVKEANRPIVVNRPITERPDWPSPAVRQMIAVQMAEGENDFGCLAAFNHLSDAEFGTIEASLLGSVAAILGIHGGNIELYRQQSELIEGIIHSLSSAIDAKDPYTCGHSDRVARSAVRLAEEMGCDAGTLKTIYLAGLLHDVGKIGVEDRVLRKPDKLSSEEYEHIKRHTEIGHRILRDLSKLENVLPVVLHHHESWNGDGYPHRLVAERIPPAARIVAVTDAFDAMTSDRPYRKGMSDQQVDAILRAGAGRQWDPAVIDAFFRCRDDLRRICRQPERATVT